MVHSLRIVLGMKCERFLVLYCGIIDIYGSMDDMWYFISCILHECLDQLAPFHSIQCKKSHHPVDSMFSICHQAKQAKRKVEHTKNDEDILLCKKLKNHLKCLVQEDKLDYVRV